MAELALSQGVICEVTNCDGMPAQGHREFSGSNDCGIERGSTTCGRIMNVGGISSEKVARRRQMDVV